MGRAVVTERDVRQWRARQEQVRLDQMEEHQERLEGMVSASEMVSDQKPFERSDQPPDPEALDRVIAEALSQRRQAIEEQRRRAQQAQEDQGRVPSSLLPAAPPIPDSYMDRLLKYIPAESVALYLTLQGIILSGAAEAPHLNTWLWFVLVIGLIGTVLYQWRVLKIGKAVQLAVSTAAFGVWVFALGGAFATMSWYEPFIGSLTLVIFTFFAPLISPDVLSTDQE